MKAPDPDKERSEKPLTLEEFMKIYNQDLPESYPRVSTSLLTEFKNSHRSFFGPKNLWSLDLHRKKVMDWLQLIVYTS